MEEKEKKRGERKKKKKKEKRWRRKRLEGEEETDRRSGDGGRKREKGMHDNEEKGSRKIKKRIESESNGFTKAFKNLRHPKDRHVAVFPSLPFLPALDVVSR